MIEQKYPSGRVVKNVLDNDGDLFSVQSKKNQTAGYFDYAKNFTYTAAGAVSSMQLGNGRWESTIYNSRLQPTQIALGTAQNGVDLLKLDYTYNTPNRADNNGNVQSQTITVPNGFTATQNYTYDSLNRIKQATETINGGQSWKQTFLYDRYGNRNFDTSQTTTLGSCSQTQCNPTVNVANNQFNSGQGYTYDSSGNVIADAEGRSFNYDAENKQKSVSNTSGTIGTYFYDGDGKRGKKVSATETTIFVYDAFGKLVAEYSNQISQTPQVSYLTTDHLGSPRINTDANGNVIARHDYHPFGEEIYTPQRNNGVGYADDSVRNRFTSYERDIESSLDFAQARYYGYGHGRFTSPDVPFAEQIENKPQSWNLYVYVGNNPLRFIDPLGLWKKVPCSGSQNICYEAEEGDTYETLAEMVNGSGKLLAEFFNNQEIAAGQAFGLDGYLSWSHETIGRALQQSWDSGNFFPPIGIGGVTGKANTVKKAGLLSRLWNGAKSFFGFGGKSATTTSTAKATASVLSQVLAKDRNNLTWVGRALQKHSSRAGSVYKTTANNPSQYNQAGETLAKEILENPAAVKLPNRLGVSSHNRGKSPIEIYRHNPSNRWAAVRVYRTVCVMFLCPK
ncbi:MAG: hypothetical protein H0W58_06215 [Acidobacteria bacterium]|nr:hypothetical protein [Acidobacteriota bacterium]